MNKKTNIIGFKEFRLNADKYIDAVRRGKFFTVVRRSTPVFNITPVDEWGDEGVWESVVDFRNKKGKGIRAEKLLALLKKIDGNIFKIWKNLR